MSKTVKFNLILDGYPVRNIEGLQEHFSIEDMLGYYNNGILARWLEVRNYSEQLEKVRAITKSGMKEIARELVSIFEIETDDGQVEKALAIFSYLEEERMVNQKYRENAYKKSEIINDYHVGYDALIQHMIDNRSDMALLKADVLELERTYFGLFQLDYYSLYFRLLKEAPRAIYAMLTRPALSRYYLIEDAPSQLKRSLDYDIIPIAKIHEYIQDDVTVVKRDTQGMWDPIERGDVELIVLYVESTGAFVKNYQGALDEKLGAADINGQFKIFHGLEYQCNSSTYELVYMEV